MKMSIYAENSYNVVYKLISAFNRAETRQEAENIENIFFAYVLSNINKEKFLLIDKLMMKAIMGGRNY